VLVDVLKSCWASTVLNVRPVFRAFTVEKLLPCWKTGSRMCVCTVCFGVCERPVRQRVKNMLDL